MRKDGSAWGSPDGGRSVDEVVRAYGIFFSWCFCFLREIGNKVISNECRWERSYWEFGNKGQDASMD